EFAPCPPTEQPSLSAALGDSRELLFRWVTAVERLDADEAASFYAETGMAFWGTFGDHCRTSRTGAHDYFRRFLAADSIQCSVRETHWRALGEKAVLATGWYEFRIARDGAPAQAAPARFTFAFRRMPDRSWLIIEHHSSLFPENGY
nr:DUF4440 domain-containing protein [Akkermansiaceae bacterium]